MDRGRGRSAIVLGEVASGLRVEPYRKARGWIGVGGGELGSIERDGLAAEIVVRRGGAGMPHPERPAVLEWCDGCGGSTLGEGPKPRSVEGPEVRVNGVRGFVSEPTH